MINNIYLCHHADNYNFSIYDKDFKFVLKFTRHGDIFVINDYTIFKTTQCDGIAFKNGKRCDEIVNYQLDAIMISDLFVFGDKLYEILERYVSKQKDKYFMYIKSKSGEKLILTAERNWWKKVDYESPEIMNEEVFNKFIALELEKQDLQKQLAEKQLEELKNTPYDPHNVDYFIKMMELKSDKPINERQKAFLVGICSTVGIAEDNVNHVMYAIGITR